jgi:glycosyltransferase involved in cell wall biosynthesis
MKIMIVTPYFYPKIGGLENYALNVAIRFKKRGDDVFVVTSNHVGKEYLEERIQGIRVIRLPVTFKFSNTPIGLKWSRRIKKIIKLEKPDVINAHSPVPGMADIAIRAAYKLHVPSVLTYHAASLKKDGSLLFNFITAAYNLLQKPTFKKTTKIIAVSDYVKVHLPEKYQEKTSIAYNAIDVDEIPKTKIKRQTNRLVFVGSLDRTHAWKGLSSIIEALQIVSKKESGVELLVLGDGDMRAEYENQAKELGLEKNIQFKGFVTGNNKYNLIRSATALIAYPTTENDAFPTVFTEAWACGTPIIAAKIGALESLITNKLSGLLVKSKSPSSLATVIRSLLEDEQLKKTLATHGAKIVREQFLWDQTIDETTKQFVEISGKKLYYAVNFPIDNQLAPSIHVHEVCNNLAKSGYKVTLVGPSISKNIQHSYEFHKVHYPKILTPITYQLFLSIELLKLLRGSRKTLYIRQEPFMFAPQMIRPFVKSQTIVEVNGILEEEVLENPLLPMRTLFKKTKFFQFIEKTAYRHAQKIIVVTPGVKTYLMKKYSLPASKIIVVANGVNTDKLKPINVKVTDHSLGFIGNLMPYQGLDYIIKAFKLLLSDLPEASLYIYGSGPEKDKLLSLIQSLDLEKSAFIKGSVDHDKIPEIINSFSCCVAYYTKERDGMNSPFKVLEYLSCGRPVVLSDLSGFRESFGDNVEYVKPEDYKDLAKHMKHSLIHDQQKAWQTRRKLILENYSWVSVCNKLNAVIETA